MGGAGKSALAAVACWDRRVLSRFRDGVTWLDAGGSRDPVALQGDLARRLGMPSAEASFTEAGQGRDVLSAALSRRRLLIVVDNVRDRHPVDALIGLGPGCPVLFTTRRRDLAVVFGAAEIEVDELAQEQALCLLGQWTGQPDREQAGEAAVRLCARLGNLPLAITVAGAMVARGHTLANVAALIEQDLELAQADLDPKYRYATRKCRSEARSPDGERAFLIVCPWFVRGF
jgi:NB-ARC domain